MDPSVYPEDRKPCSLSRYVGTEAHLVPSETQVKAQRERERERERQYGRSSSISSRKTGREWASASAFSPVSPRLLRR